MKRLPLFRKRQIWIPTALGSLLLVAMAATIAAILVTHIYGVLALTDPAPLADTLIVEGWISDDELEQAIAVVRRGRYRKIITTGGPVEARFNFRESSNYADEAARYLMTRGLQDRDITAVPAPASAQDRTFLSAVMVRDWVAKSGRSFAAFDVFSSGTHARRSRLLYRMAFGSNVQVGVLSSLPQDYDGQRWWQSSAGAKSVMTEAVSLLWTLCCFHPAPPGTHDERWGSPIAPRSPP